MKMSVRLLLYLYFATGLAHFSQADQAAYVSKADAEKVLAVLPVGMEVRMFCEPCNDERWSYSMVKEIVVRDTGDGEHFEVVLNGVAINLAYTFFPNSGKWANLAKHLALPVDGVSETLGENVKGKTPEFFRSHFQGFIDSRLAVLMDLTKDANDLFGVYIYTSKGAPLRLTGSVDTQEAFSITEFDNEKMTGVFSGDFGSLGVTMDGQWSSPDGQHKLPFSFQRIAIQVAEDRTERIGKRDVFVHLDFPRFELPNRAVSLRLNDAVEKAVRDELQRELDTLAEPIESTTTEPDKQFEPQEADAGASEFSVSIGEYRLVHISRSFASLVFSVYANAGGAHPNTWSMPLNFALSPDLPAKPILLKDVIQSGAEALSSISAYCIAELKKADASLIMNGSIEALTSEQLSKFALSSRDITFFFDPYAVASYAEGPFEIAVPFESISTALKMELLNEQMAPASSQATPPTSETKKE